MFRYLFSPYNAGHNLKRNKTLCTILLADWFYLFAKWKSSKHFLKFLGTRTFYGIIPTVLLLY